jgi:hypothetical protein
MRTLTILPVLAAAAVLASGASAALPAHCATKSIGPGSLQRGGTTGASCFLAAFDNGCRAADYTLSQFGVDTIHSLTFTTQHRTTGCTVLVTESFRVIPRQAHVTAHYVCHRLHALVADRCTPKRTVSLTTLST